MLSVIILNVANKILLSVIMLNIVMLCVMAPPPISQQGLFKNPTTITRKSYRMGLLSMIDLLSKLTCFVKKANNVFKIKSSWSKLVSTRRSTVLGLPL